MLFSRLIQFKTNISRYLLHSALFVGVVVYAICGAFIIQSIEQPPKHEDSKSLRERIHNIDKLNWETLSGADIAERVPSVNDCILNALKRIASSENCLLNDIDESKLDDLDQCYTEAALDIIENSEQLKAENTASDNTNDKWNFVNSVLFSYTVITTIGYGHVAPVTAGGRIFCVIYGIIGIPFTLLTIADLGMFLSKSLKDAASGLSQRFYKIHTLRLLPSKSKESLPKHNFVLDVRDSVKDNGNSERLSDQLADDSTDENERNIHDSMVLGIAFFTYLILGSYIFSLYEPEMDFLKAIYFNFVTLTTIGLGDLVPQSGKFLLVTLLYTTVGLALTTIAMEIAADLLKKIHYFGRKIENVSNITVWFGGEKMSLKRLVQHFGDHMNVPVDELKNLNLDTFVSSAIKVEAGEIKTLRKPKVVMRNRSYPNAFRYSDIRKSGESETLRYIDEQRNSSVFESAPATAVSNERKNFAHKSIFSLSSKTFTSTGRSNDVIVDCSRLPTGSDRKMVVNNIKINKQNRD